MTAETLNESSPRAKSRRNVDSGHALIVPEIGLTEIGGEPRARDTDLADRLGFERPRKIRELIERNLSEIETFGACPALGRVVRGNPVSERWLNEEQALLVAILSDAPNAPAVRTMLIKTFVAWRRGHLSAPNLPTDTIEEIHRIFGINKMLSHKVTEIEKTVAELERAKVAPTFDYAGTVTADQIIEIAGIKREDRTQGTAKMVTSRLTDFCEPHELVRTAADLNPRRPWRFPRAKAHEWLFGKTLGAEQIRNQMARVRSRKIRRAASDQASLRLVPPQSPTQKGA